MKEDRQISRSFTFTISEEEETYVLAVCQARCNAGLSANMNDFLRQAINFALNNNPRWTFGRPPIKKVYFKTSKE